MKNLIVVLALAALPVASAQTCILKVTGSAKLKDAHHVAYSVTVSNPSAKPVTFNLRIDFFYKSQKLQGGFENLIGMIPSKGQKVFTGNEPFIETLKGADALKVTKIRKCN